MIYQLFIRPEVESDIREAAEHYEREASPELAKDFVREVRKAIRRIRENPLLFMVRHKRLQVRWAFPRRFPYRIVFVAEDDIVTVLCVVHAKRHDRVWRIRT
jgi:plasmid stabilization system protein ParE